MVWLVVLIFCLAAINGKWATPMEITSYMEGTKITKDVYTDAASGVTHIAHCNSSDGNLYYTRLDETGLFITGPISLSSVLRCFHVEISGPNDGQRVYIAMEARRTMATDECTSTDLGSCDDLYVIESVDGGVNWKTPNNVGGTPGDPVRRRGFKLLTNWKYNHFWLMYAKYEGSNTAVMSVKYEPEKSRFSPEKVVLPKFSALSNYQLITYNDKGDSTLIFAYATPFTLTLQTVISTDNGETWKKGEGLKSICDSGKYVLKNLISSGKYLIAGCSKKEQIHFSFSDDSGKTWTTPEKFQSDEIEEIAFCGKEEPNSPERQMNVLFRVQRSMKIAHSSITKKLEWKTVEVPDAFYFGASKMDLTCIYKSNEMKYRMLYHVRTNVQGSSKYTFYIIDNDNVQDTPSTNQKPDL